MRMAVVAALVLIAACDNDGSGGGGLPPGGAYSCRAAFAGTDGGANMPVLCLEVSGGTAQDLANNRQQCAAQGNTFVLEPCPREGALGGCRETAVGVAAVITTWYYAYGGSSQTTADIQMLCQGLASVAPATLRIEFVPP